ncbi:hypothetical protein NDU88_000748 [Pleurodeles waltl]|uniref:Macroglobulin domain-containing protein n=1 Tax=Pleurodeles waltl TaxID=8319 RepID=A0AAV7P955_PLEWA|nr:hypothetical protein NDU88_000748 [Pleurodeles waltl]
MLERSGCFSKKVELDFFNKVALTEVMTFNVNGSVTEDDTGVTISGSKSCQLSSVISTVTFEETDEYYKKGIPYTGWMKLASADGTPIKGQTIYLFTEWGSQRLNQSYETDDSGRAFFCLDTCNWSYPVSLRVTLGFSQEEALPGADISLHLHSDAGSLCTVRAVDKSTVLMKPKEELTRDKV